MPKHDFDSYALLDALRAGTDIDLVRKKHLGDLRRKSGDVGLQLATHEKSLREFLAQAPRITGRIIDVEISMSLD